MTIPAEADQLREALALIADDEDPDDDSEGLEPLDRPDTRSGRHPRCVGPLTA